MDGGGVGLAGKNPKGYAAAAEFCACWCNTVKGCAAMSVDHGWNCYLYEEGVVDIAINTRKQTIE